jgi:tellurium resistance protein TerD
MGIFDRISNILKAKTNNSREQARDLERNFSSVMGGLDRRIDQARDRASGIFGFGRSNSQTPSQNSQNPELPPSEQIAETEKVFDKMIKEIDQAIEEARLYVAEFTSIENKLYQEKNAALEKVKEWKERAERAILTHRDDIARDALIHKQEFEQVVASYQSQIDAQETVSNQVKEQLQALVSKRAEVKRNKDLLISRQRSLEIQERMNKAFQGQNGQLQNDLEKIEKNLMQAEALAEAQAELQGYPKPSSSPISIPSINPINPLNPLTPSRSSQTLDEELSRSENKAIAEQQMKEIRNRFETPKQKIDPWFSEPTPVTPPQKKELWFDESKPSVSVDETKKEKAKQIWFDEDKTKNTPPKQETKKEIWFDESNIPPTKEAPKNIWFDNPNLEETSNKNPTKISKKRANSDLPNQNTLQPGANISLSKALVDLSKLEVRIGWESAKENVDLNSSIILTIANGKVKKEEDFIYYNNPISSCKAVKHLGADGSDFDNEIISLNFTKIPPDITKIVFSVMIYEAETRKQTFQSVSAVWLRITNPKDGKEITNYLYTNKGQETVLILGEIYLYKGEWKFKAIGQGFAAGLVALLESFGVSVG